MAIQAILENVKARAVNSPLILSAALFLVVASFVRYLLNRPKRLNFPVVDVSSAKTGKDYMKLLVEGSAKYSDTPFVLNFSPPLVILPISIMDEVRNLPENQVSFMKEVRRILVHRHTGLGDDNPEVIAAVKVDLTRHIASTLDGLQDEIRYALDKEFGPCEDWTPYVLYQKMARIVALLSGRVFVGRPLSREEEWLESTIKFTFDANEAARAVKKWNIFLRPFVAPFLPEIKRVKLHKARGGELLQPLLKMCLDKANNEKSDTLTDPFSGDEQGTFISWILKHTSDVKREDATVLGNNQMALSFAAIHTTTMATCQIIYDLICRPSYIQPLRDEIASVLAEDGYDLDSEGYLKLKKPSLSKLRKLDSFIKESQRLSPPGLVSNSRVTTAPLTLSTGQTLPTGTSLAFPAYPVHTSSLSPTFSPTYNPPSYKSPLEFDGYRFSNLRSMPGKENKHQFVTTASDSLNFGHGNHACPGRFFASNEIKVIIIELLRSWDFRIKGDVEQKGGEDKRPENFCTELQVVPNMTAEVEFRRREVS